jgi:hypothetical protein
MVDSITENKNKPAQPPQGAKPEGIFVTPGMILPQDPESLDALKEALQNNTTSPKLEEMLNPYFESETLKAAGESLELFLGKEEAGIFKDCVAETLNINLDAGQGSLDETLRKMGVREESIQTFKNIDTADMSEVFKELNGGDPNKELEPNPIVPGILIIEDDKEKKEPGLMANIYEAMQGKMDEKEQVAVLETIAATLNASNDLQSCIDKNTMSGIYTETDIIAPPVNPLINSNSKTSLSIGKS